MVNVIVTVSLGKVRIGLSKNMPRVIRRQILTMV